MFNMSLQVISSSIGFLGFLAALFITVAAVAVPAVITSQAQKSAAKKQISTQQQTAESVAQQQLQTEEAIAEKQLAAKEKETTAQIKLTEEQLMLEAQRSQIETLSNIMQTERIAKQTRVEPQYFPAPQPVARLQGFASRINSFIDNLLRG